MKTATPKSRTLKAAVAWSIAQQVLVFAWASFTDLNVFTSTQILHAIAAYWVWFFVFVWRRRAADAHDDIDGDMGILWRLGSVVHRELDDLVDQRMVTRLSRSGCNPRVSSAGS